jgi:isopentenyl diphosphate isomerase/L-lactate dehydrogenase-like FMN-dependent dehydrogenase
VPQPTIAPVPAGRIPAGVHCARDYESLARGAIPAPTYEYIAGGSGEGVTLAANLAAFGDVSICPRLLADVTGGSTRLGLAGRDRAHPILLAPVALQALVHPRGELDVARAAAAVDACMVVSTLSSHRLEDVATATDEEKWFQLYFQPRRDDTLDLVHRAQAAGYAALVVTLDAAIQAPALSALRAGFRMPAECVAANLHGYAARDEREVPPGQSRIFQAMMRAAPTWADLEWLQAHANLPIWIKGVLHRDDARRLRELGVAGLVVSNHGGRTLDHAPASLRMLPVIRDAVGPDCPLLFDGGIRSGADVFKAIALGADAVMVGRLQVYALAVAGALGVAHMLRLLREELEICMAMAGCASLADVRRAGCVLRASTEARTC